MSDTPKPIKLQSDGQVSARRNADGSVSMNVDQPLSMHIESIKSVGIANIVDVEEHAINQLFGSVSHYVRFFGGGEVRFSYNAAGEILEFTASRVDVEVADGERLLLKMQTEAGEASV